MTDEPLLAREKVLVLLAEYSMLRAEILQRNSVLNGLLAAGGAATVALIGLAFTKSFWVSLVLLIVAWAIGFVAFRLLEFDTLAAARHVRDLEATINLIAGERLLTWETDHDLPTVGYRERIKYVFGR